MSLRTVVIDGEPWFVAKDVTDAMGVEKPARAIEAAGLDATEFRTFNVLNSRGRPPMIVSESGLYALVMNSRKSCLPSASVAST